jgi:hypothetical protein
MDNFISFIATMFVLVVGLAILSVVFAVVVSIAIRAFRGNT